MVFGIYIRYNSFIKGKGSSHFQYLTWFGAAIITKQVASGIRSPNRKTERLKTSAEWGEGGGECQAKKTGN